ncbi:MAG: hypothetical protein ACP5E4_00160 [Candidatus Aenigmatarchaeota archaeon]
MAGTVLRGTSIMPFVFIILLAVIAIIAWGRYGGGPGGSYLMELSDAKSVNLVKGEIESAKRFSKHGLLYASDQAIGEHALGGGINSGGTVKSWVCNTADPPVFGEIKACLEKSALEYANSYLSSFSSGPRMEDEFTPFESVSYEVTEADVLSGKYDEGGYMISAQGGKISVSSEGMKASDGISINEEAGKNRFWYLYRIFYEWSAEGIFPEKSLECAGICLGCECIEHAAEDALEALRGKFDEDVSCGMKRVCCTRGPSRLTGLLNGAEFWDQSECIASCSVSCGTYSGAIDKEPFQNVPQTYAGDGVSDSKIAAVYEFSCTDKKYFVAGSEGPEALIFKVLASVSYDDFGAC